tara:strand:+ start:424 stop:2055 length:1632 start_codon:yes stop_codon:yes gene_type:complete
MAKMEIYQSKAQAKTQQVMNVGGTLSLPFEIAQAQGASINKLTSAVKKIRDQRQATQDKNKARKIIKDIDPDIKNIFKDFQNSSDVANLEDFYKKTDIKNFKRKLWFKNKRVKELVGDYIYKEQIQLGDRLMTKITTNHALETQQTHDDELAEYKLKASSNDQNTRNFGYRDIESWFADPNNQNKYPPAVFQKLYNDTFADIRKLQLQFNIKNDPGYVIDNFKAISKKIGNKKEAKKALKAAKKSWVSKQISKDWDELQIEEADTKQKIANFAEIIKRVNSGEEIPTLDDLDDLFDEGGINSSQYAMIINFYGDPKKLSKRRVVDMINAQLFVAKDAEQLDALEKQINFDADLITQLNVKDISAFKTIFDKYIQDKPGFKMYQHFGKKLNTNLGKIENSGGYVLGSGKSSESDNQLTRIDGMKMYNDLIAADVQPGDAYIQTLNAYQNEITLPTIYQVVQPTSIKILEPPKDTVKDPGKWFEDKRKEVLENYKNGTIDFNLYQADVNAVGIIEDYFKVLQSIDGQVFAFADKRTAISTGEQGE